MLVCSRKRWETIEIGPIPPEAVGETITVTLTEVGKGVARIGVDADRAIPVHRGERATPAREAR